MKATINAKKRKMFEIRISRLAEGKNDINIKVGVKAVKGLTEEFFGEIELLATITKVDNNFAVKAKVYANANLLCDMSSEKFSEEIVAEIDIVIVQDSMITDEDGDSQISSDSTIYISDENVFIDLTEEVRQQLMLNIPMKKVAPQYRGKNITEINPEMKKYFVEGNRNKESEKETDKHWAALEDLKFN